MFLDIFGLDDSAFLAVIAVVFIVNLIILYQIIRSATSSRALERHAYIQTQLMIKMAARQGVDADEIIKILKQADNKERPENPQGQVFETVN